MKRSLNSLFKPLAEFMDLVKLFPAWPWKPNNFYGKKTAYLDCLKLAQKNTAAVKAWDVSIFSLSKEHSAYSSAH